MCIYISEVLSDIIFHWRFDAPLSCFNPFRLYRLLSRFIRYFSLDLLYPFSSHYSLCLSVFHSLSITPLSPLNVPHSLTLSLSFCLSFSVFLCHTSISPFTFPFPLLPLFIAFSLPPVLSPSFLFLLSLSLSFSLTPFPQFHIWKLIFHTVPLRHAHQYFSPSSQFYTIIA